MLISHYLFNVIGGLSNRRDEIIDKEDRTMAEFLNEAMQIIQGGVSIATGYFNVVGCEVLQEELREAAKRSGFNLRLLIGIVAVVRKDAAHPVEVEPKGSLPQEVDGNPERSRFRTASRMDYRCEEASVTSSSTSSRLHTSICSFPSLKKNPQRIYYRILPYISCNS